MSRWLDGLNPEQQQAALHDYGPLLILAGAGSGKTTVLVARTGRLIEEKIVDPEQMCVLTFTNKAARELKTRVTARLGNTAKKVWAGTFHSFGLMLLKKYYQQAGLPKEFGILDGTDASGMVKELLSDFNLAGKTAFDTDSILEKLSRWREKGQQDADRDDEYEIAVEWLLPRYQKRLKRLGMVDFDGLILRPLELMRSDPQIADAIRTQFQQVMVDEFQDTNLMQMRFVKSLVGEHRNISVVGDDDQSIYGWRGACVSNILDFPKTYSGCKVVRLERNYRCSTEVLALANAVISKNTERHPKVLKPCKVQAVSGHLPELFVYDNEATESESIAVEIQQFQKEGVIASDIAVLYRSNSQGALLEAELRKSQIPYRISGGTAFFDRKEARDVLAYLRCSMRPHEIAVRRILNCPSRGVGDKTVEQIETLAAVKNLKFIDALKQWRDAGVDPKSGAGIDEFHSLLDQLPGRIFGQFADGIKIGKPGENLIRFFESIGYKKHLEKMGGNPVSISNRWRIVETMAGILERYLERGGGGIDSLGDFIDAMELRDAMEEKDDQVPKVQLMTLHACKGLEFSIVFLMGVEEDILPHRVLGSDISEERRLFYVGITRARDRLILTRARQRRKHGKWIDSPPSRFLLEVSPDLYVQFHGSRPINESKRKAMVAELFRKLDGLG
jgi:superfamily I DNA/RNA helicase